MVVTLAPHRVPLDLIRALAARGVSSASATPRLLPRRRRRRFDAGARAVTHLYNAMSQLGHRAARPGRRGARRSPDVFAASSPTAITCTRRRPAPRFTAKGAERITLISDAMPPAAGGPDVLSRRPQRHPGRLEADARRRHARGRGDHPDGRRALRDADAGDRPRRRAEDGDADPGAPVARRSSPRPVEAGLCGRSRASCRRSQRAGRVDRRRSGARPWKSASGAQRAAHSKPRRRIVRISGTSNSLATWPSEE